jgi:hypothetical protein
MSHKSVLSGLAIYDLRFTIQVFLSYILELPGKSNHGATDCTEIHRGFSVFLSVLYISVVFCQS